MDWRKRSEGSAATAESSDCTVEGLVGGAEGASFSRLVNEAMIELLEGSDWK